MKQLKNFFIIFTFMLLALPSSIAFAQDSDPGEAAEFSATKIKPDAPQVDANSAFYDLLVQPGDTVTIQAELTNYSADENTIKMGNYTTFTNDNGEINYSAALPEDRQDESLELPFSAISSLMEGDTVTLAPGEKKVVSMGINVPQDAKNGVVLGSWYFEKQTAENQAPEQEEGGVVIDNRFAYAMAVKLTIQEEVASPNMNLLTVEPGLNNYQKVINAKVQNDQAAILSELAFTGEITRQGNDRVLLNQSLENRVMAPNSNYNVPFFFGERQLEPGDYTLHLQATTTDPKWEEQTWEWTEDFTITREQSNQINQAAVNDPEPEPNYLIYILIGIILLLILILIVVLFRKKQGARKEES
ncbi:DUF916 and DUF3324 domain-containing protein [Enterococcus sp. AZ109]|uniref:DUF916 and DUF3324 domain-containing protein n=1 Tax=Enterococcus sp. AZ109 TaxID=2774634 RepID=UPI003F1F81AB